MEIVIRKGNHIHQENIYTRKSLEIAGTGALTGWSHQPDRAPGAHVQIPSALHTSNSHLSSCRHHQHLRQELFHKALCHKLHHKLPRPLLAGAPLLRQRLDISHPLERHPFPEPVHSAGELLHTPQRISPSMTTVLLCK